MKTDLTVGGYIFYENRVLLIYHAKRDLWLCVGGHIEKDETPDEAIKREAAEEVNLTIEILNRSDISTEGNVKENLAIPFYVNVHFVGDHDHCCFFYICQALNPKEIKIKDGEIKDFRWFAKNELNEEFIPIDVRNECLAAFNLFGKINEKTV